MKVAKGLLGLAFLNFCTVVFAGGGPLDRFPSVNPTITLYRVKWADKQHRHFVKVGEVPRSRNSWELYVKPGESVLVEYSLNDTNNLLANVALRYRVLLDGPSGVLRQEKRFPNVFTASAVGAVTVQATVYSVDPDPVLKFHRTVEEVVNVSPLPPPSFRIESAYTPSELGVAFGTLSNRVFSNVSLTGASIQAHLYGDVVYVTLFSDQGYATAEVRLPIRYAEWSADPGTTQLTTSWVDNGVTKSTTTLLPDGLMSGGIQLPAPLPPTTFNQTSVVVSSNLRAAKG